MGFKATAYNTTYNTTYIAHFVYPYFGSAETSHTREPLYAIGHQACMINEILIVTLESKVFPFSTQRLCHINASVDVVWL